MNRSVWLVVGVLAGVFLLSQTASASSENADSAEDVSDDMNSMGVTAAMRDLAIAISHAEGFAVRGSIPQRANNPGDLVVPGWTGAKLGDQGISVFNSPTDGWNHLYKQLSLMASGRSRVYTPDMTFAEIGATWTATQSDAWTDNVVAHLQSKGYDVDSETTLAEYLA